MRTTTLPPTYRSATIQRKPSQSFFAKEGKESFFLPPASTSPKESSPFFSTDSVQKKSVEEQSQAPFSIQRLMDTDAVSNTDAPFTTRTLIDSVSVEDRAASHCGPGTNNPFCLPIPDPDAPCQPFARIEQAEAAWNTLSTEIPLLTAAATGCSEVKPVWEAYFAATSAPFAFANSSSCVVEAAKTDPEGSERTNRSAKGYFKDVVDNLPVTLRGITPLPFPFGGLVAERRLPLEEAIGTHGPAYLHPNIIYNHPFNAAANIAGGVGTQGEGSDVFGDDDRLVGGLVIIEVHAIDSATGMLSGQVRWRPHVHVKDTVDFCPGNLGNSMQLQFTVPMSKLEATGLTRDVPITIDYDLEVHQENFNVLPLVGPLPPGPTPPAPVPVPPVPPPNSQFRSRRFAGQSTLEACGAGKHRMLRHEKDTEAVRKVQETLVEAGMVVTVDGDFGGETEQAVAKFKREHTPPLLPSDGVVGPKTSLALDAIAVAHGQ